MKTSAAGRALIIEREGSKLTAYRDSKGVLTIGVGHTGRMTPPPVTAGMRITAAECEAMLAADLAPIETAINTVVKVPMTQNEFDALVSLGFNIGPAGLKASTVIKKLNVGDVRGGALAFMNWSKPAILTARRSAEKAQFLTPDAPTSRDAESRRTVAATRSDVLQARATETKAQAKRTQTRSVAMASVGIVATAVSASSSHWSWALILAAIVAVGVVVDVLVIWSRLNMVKTLAANAASQALVAAPPASAASLTQAKA